MSVYESKFAKSKLKSGRWTRSKGSLESLPSRQSHNYFNKRSESANEWAKGEGVKFSYPCYFMSEDYHLAEMRNDEPANIVMVQNSTSPSLSNLAKSHQAAKRPATNSSMYRTTKVPDFSKQPSRGLMPKCTFINNLDRINTGQLPKRLARSGGRQAVCTPIQVDYKGRGVPSFNQQLGRNEDLFQVKNNTCNHLGVYDNAYINRQSAKSVFDFRKQPSRESIGKTHSISSIDFVP